ncbi:integumentary mucin A.1-like [Spodoptera frugiperda]|uniref:Integumentary mucin A.1-like n=1 Tax=Spodoptera frugiperda TaxID=7108 RepID=A0A9R0EEQ0_SPOFR|nr:integumentary mucin A.1-like [Spodoptera frugiperda]
MKGIIILLVIVYAAVGRAQLEECPKEQESNWEIEWLLRHEDCEKFYKCTFGKPVEMSCPSNLWFNLDTWRCDWPQNVDCEDRNIPTTTSSTTSTTTITPPPTTESTTTSTTTTTTTPPPTTTSTTTTTTTPPPTTTSTTTTTTTPPPTTTSTTTTTTTTTPPPTTTSTTTTTTTTPPPTTTSTTSTTTTPPPTTTSTTTTTPCPTTPSTTTTTTTTPPIEIPDEFLPNGCPVNPRIHWLLPHETDCNAFYYCVWGELVLRHCPPTLHFNRKIQVCDWPWAAGCPNSLHKHLISRLLLR